jgi:hypothetical protein
VTIEEALASTGGLGKFQILVLLTQICNMSGGSSSLYCMSYFELEPKYECLNDGQWETCVKDEFCDTENPVEFQVDWTSVYSLKNWIEEYDMHCSPSVAFGIFGSLYFLAVVIFSIIIPPLADKIGRKKVLITSSVV